MPKCNCKKDKCLSPAVLQINNYDCPTVFHKVTFPAAMGDDETNPPRNGQYRNVLLVYEANGHVYMFSSDGIPTLISDGGSGTTDYEELTNKPSIEGHELVDDSSLEDIGVTDAIEDALEDYTPTSELAEVAFTGDYEDLENTPTPPVTHFYYHGSGEIEDPFPFYNDANFTNQTTYQQFEDAVLSGPVQIFQEYDAYAYMVANVELMNAEVSDNIAFWVSGDKQRAVYRWMSTDSAPVLENVESYSYQPDWNANDPNSFAYIRNKPTIPTVNNATLTINQNGVQAGTFTANAASDTTISLTDTTYSDFSGATSSAAGARGLVPAPSAGDEGKVLHGNGTWQDATAKLVEMSYGESDAWAKFIAAYRAGSIVYCRASSQSDPGTGTQGRKAFMAYVNNAENPTEVEFQYVRSVSSKTSSQPVDQVFVYKLTNASGGTWTVQSMNMAPKLAAGTNASVSYSNGTYTVSATQPTVPEIKRRTNASTTIDISPLYVAGDGTTTYPMALKTHGDDRAGSFAYININEPTNSITEAYAGGYVWDMDEDWWRKMSEVRLALYSDIPTAPTRTVIYNNASGTNADFTTTAAMSGYDAVEITYRDGNQNYETKTVPGSASSFVLDISHPGADSTVYWYISRFLVSGTSVTVGANNTRKAITASGVTSTSTQDIYVTRVVGINY